MHGEVAALRKVLAQQAVDVLIAAALPRRVRIGEVDRQSGRLLDALVLKHLVALVPGQRPPQLNRQLAERGDECVSYGLGGVISSYGDQDCGSELALDQGRDRRPLTGTDDQITLPVARHGPIRNFRRPLADVDHVRDAVLALPPACGWVTATPARCADARSAPAAAPPGTAHTATGRSSRWTPTSPAAQGSRRVAGPRSVLGSTSCPDPAPPAAGGHR